MDTKAKNEVTRALLSLGSNLGDREKMLSMARCAVGRLVGTKVVQASRILDNPALLYLQQADFLNQVIAIDTQLGVEELLAELQAIETSLGRKPRFRYGPREIDLDILSYGALKLETATLKLPHPALNSRPYLRPLLADLGTNTEVLLSKASPLETLT